MFGVESRSFKWSVSRSSASVETEPPPRSQTFPARGLDGTIKGATRVDELEILQIASLNGFLNRVKLRRADRLDKPLASLRTAAGGMGAACPRPRCRTRR